MPENDATRWNARYRERGLGKWSKPRDLLVSFQELISPGDLVLDMAMGLGANAKFLSERGCRVVGVDISNVAVHFAKQHCGSIMPFIGDSGSINFLSSSFDVILNFYFLDRRLFFLYERVLKPGGVLIFETPSEVSVSTDFPEEYLLTKNEILQVFPSWDILYRNKVRVPSESRGMKVIEKIILRKV